jgi:hypothetical protein
MSGTSWGSSPLPWKFSPTGSSTWRVVTPSGLICGGAQCLAVALDDASVARLWGFRKKCVSLLATNEGGRQGIAFAEDTAVPPARDPS